MSVLKDTKQALLPYYTVLFNIILETGIIPFGWKHAIFRPIFKKGDPSLINNYRPISNLSSLSKLFERIILDILKKLNSEIDGLNQHGFRPHHSTLMAALEIQTILADFLDQKKEVGIYSVDLSAAFDLVDVNFFNCMCQKGEMNPWIRRILVNFLLNRSSSVKIGLSTSCPFKLSVGCAQGSTLGPKIFNIYVSDLIEMEKDSIKIVSYADDSYVIVAADNRQALIDIMTTQLLSH